MALAENAEKLLGGIFDSSAYSQDELDLLQLADDPRFRTRDYDKIGYSGDFKPQMHAAPEAAEYQTISEDPRTREFQMQALARMQKYADQSADSAEALGRYNAVSDANAVAAQREAGIRNQMAMRGQGGAGMEFVLQQQAAQAGANRAQAGGLNAAQQAALQRLQGTQGVMAGASNVRGMDANVAAQNADIINRFNMYNTGNRNAVNMANVDATNAAGLRNVNTMQGITGANTGLANASLDRDDRNKVIGYNTKRDKLDRKSNIRHGNAAAGGRAVGGGVGMVGDVAQMMTGGYGG